jgi:hypothetical protein
MRLVAKIFVLMFLMIPAAQAYDAKDMKQFYAEDSYPTAAQCAGCHQQIYNEWASSNHAYASISPMFHKFEQTINDLSAGTIGTFCYRFGIEVRYLEKASRVLPVIVFKKNLQRLMVREPSFRVISMLQSVEQCVAVFSMKFLREKMS